MITFNKIEKNSYERQRIKSKILNIVIYYFFKSSYSNHKEISIIMKENIIKETSILYKE